jgi:hypothetical protein
MKEFQIKAGNLPEEFNRVSKSQRVVYHTDQNGTALVPGPLLHGQFEINGIRFPVDPQGISISEENFNHKYQTLRTRESSKVRSGHSRINISVRAIFTGITGREARVPTSGASALRTLNETLMPILYSLKKMPMCFLDNELLRRNLPIASYKKVVKLGDADYEVLTGENIGAFIQSVNISTVPGMPNAITAEFQFVWFNHRPFMPKIKFRTEWADGTKGVVKGMSDRYWDGSTEKDRAEHPGRAKFIENYGHPSVAFNAAAARTNSEDIHKARPLHEYLWPYRYESTNIGDKMGGVQSSAAASLLQFPPYVLDSFDKDISFGFDIIKSPPKEVLDSIIKITDAEADVQLEKERKERRSRGLDVSTTSGTLREGDIVTWARKLNVHEDILVAAIVLNSEQPRGSLEERQAIIHSLFNNALRKGRSVWWYAVGPGNVTGKQGGRRKYSSARVPKAATLDTRIEQVKAVLDIRRTGESLQGVTSFIHPLSMKGKTRDDRIASADRVGSKWEKGGANRLTVLGITQAVSAVRFYRQGKGSTEERVQQQAERLLKGNVSTSKTKMEEVVDIDPNDAVTIIAEGLGVEGIQGPALNAEVRRQLNKSPQIDQGTRKVYDAIVELASTGWLLRKNVITGKPAMIKGITLAVPDESVGVIPLAISVGFATNLAMIPLEGHRFPTVQYTGGQHTAATISLRCEGEAGREFLSQLKSLVNSSEEAAIYFREFSDKRGIRIKNALLNSMNLREVMIENLTVDTVPGNPNGLIVNLSVIDATTNPALRPLLTGTDSLDLDTIFHEGLIRILQNGWIVPHAKKGAVSNKSVDPKLELAKAALQEIEAKGPNAIYNGVRIGQKSWDLLRFEAQNKVEFFEQLTSNNASAGAVVFNANPSIPVVGKTLQDIADLSSSVATSRRISLSGSFEGRRIISGEEYSKAYGKNIPPQYVAIDFPEAVWIILFGSKKRRSLKDYFGLDLGMASPEGPDHTTLKALVRRVITIAGTAEDGLGDLAFPKILKKITKARAYQPQHEAYPDLLLPPNPITGLAIDMTPDFFLYNESDVKLCNSNLLEIVHGSAVNGMPKKLGIRESFKAMDDSVQGHRHAYGVDPAVDGGIRPVHEGQDGSYLKQNGGEFKGYVNGQKQFREDFVTAAIGGGPVGPDLQGAMISGARGKLGQPGVSRTTQGIDRRFKNREGKKTYKRKKSLNMHMQNSPAKADFTEDSFNLNKTMHIFEEGEYKKIFQKFATSYESDHYTARRCFPTFKVFFVEENGEESRNSDTKLEAKLFTSYALDDFYGVNSVKEVRIIKSKTMAADVCVMQIMDLDGVLYNRKYLKEGDAFGNRLTKSQGARNPFLDTVIKEGMKVVVKFGYSNDPAQLETMFVGQIASWSGSHLVEIIAQSYGSELVSHRFGTDPSANADQWNVETSDLLHDCMDREEVRHFGRWHLKDIDLLGPLFGTEKLRPDGQTKRVWTWKPGAQDDNIFIPDFETYSSGWERFWGDLEYVFFDTTVWDVFKEAELRHPGYIAYPVPYGDGIDARMTMFFGHPSMEYLYRPAKTSQEREAEALGNKMDFDKRESIVGLGYDTQKRQLDALSSQSSPLSQELADQGQDVLLQQSRKELFSQGTRVLASGNRFGESVDDLAVYQPHAKEQYKRIQEMAALTEEGDIKSIPDAKFWKSTMYHQEGRMRSFRNYELVTSMHDIISNNIRCDHRDTFNSVELRYSDNNVNLADFDDGGSAESLIVNADDNIKEHHIRRVIESWPNCSTSNLARRYASQLMANSLKRTYKGDIIIVGKPKLKPYDYVWIYDNYSDMAGPVEIEEVVHTLSSDVGFITEVVPNMIVEVKEGLTVTMADAMGAFFTETIKDFTNSAISGAGTAAIGGGALATSALAGATVSATATGAAAAASGAVAGVGLTSGVGGVIAGGLGVVATAGLPITVAVSGIVAGSLLYKFLKYNLTREPIIIVPLIKQGKPFIAGVEGMESDGLVVKDIFSADEETSDRALGAIITRKWKYFGDGLSEAVKVADQGWANWVAR